MIRRPRQGAVKQVETISKMKTVLAINRLKDSNLSTIFFIIFLSRFLKNKNAYSSLPLLFGYKIQNLSQTRSHEKNIWQWRWFWTFLLILSDLRLRKSEKNRIVDSSFWFPRGLRGPGRGTWGVGRWMAGPYWWMVQTSDLESEYLKGFGKKKNTNT